MKAVRYALALGLLLGLAACHHEFKPERLSPQALESRIKHGDPVLVVDVRFPFAYMAEHIQGARNARFDWLQDGKPQGLPKDRNLALYCECPDDHMSLSAAYSLQEKLGYKHVWILHGGISAWKKAGLPVVSATEGKAHAH